MKKKIILFTYFFCQIVFVWGNDSCENVQVDYHLNRANSLHWLSRARQNSYHEAKLSLDHLLTARNILASANLQKNCKSNYLRKINSFEKQLNELIEVTTDNLNGVYPLIPFLTNQYSEFEYYDEPLEIAAESALNSLLESGIYKPSKDLKDVLLYCIVDIKGDSALKEVTIQFLNNNSKMYVISDYEISQIIGKSQIEGSDDLRKIGEFFNTIYMGKVSVLEYDSSNQVSYVGAKFEFFDLVKNLKISDTYAEGFSVNMQGKSKSFILYFLPFLLFTLLFGVLIFMVLKRRLGHLGSVLNLVLSIVIGFVLGVASSFGVLTGLSLIAPQGLDFMGEPFVMFWPYLLTELIVITPVLLFVLVGLIVKRRFSDSFPLIFLFLYSASIATVLPFLSASYVYIAEKLNFSLILVYVLGALVASLGGAYWMARGYKKNKNYLFLVTPALFFLPLGLVFHELLKVGGVSGPNPMGYVALCLTLITGITPFIVLRKKKNKSSIESPEMEKDETQLLKLKKIISFQLTDSKKSIVVDFNEKFHEAIKKITSGSIGVTHLHIEGESGIGKTTFLKDFMDRNKSSFHSFYGDCDEDQEGATIPYEPFQEAFQEFIGEGIFYKGNKAAMDLIDKASPILGAVGMDGIADTLVNNEPSFDGASTNEISQRITNHFLNLAKKQDGKNILIVIEDLHWIDNYTKILFKELLEQFTRLNYSKFGDIKIIFITTTSEKNNEKCNEIIEHATKLSKKNQLFSFMRWEEVMEEELQITNIINARFLKNFLSPNNTGIYISAKTIEEIDEFIKQTSSLNPKYILELMKFLIEKEMFVEINNVITLRSDIDWDTVPAENRMEELYYSKFSKLSEDVLKVLGSAAFIGMEFEAKLLSKLWKMDRLELIHNLLKAESSGIIIDLNDTDDYYRFSSKSIRAALKRFVLSNKTTKGKTPQIVKEYHKEIINITLSDFGVNEEPRNIAKLTNDQLFQLAERTILVYSDYPEKGRVICLEALKRSLTRGENRDVLNYLTFMSKMNFEFIFNTNESRFYFLKAVQLIISSNPQKFKLLFENNLPRFLEKKILSIQEDESLHLMIETYGEILLKISGAEGQFELIKSKHPNNHFVRLYDTLITVKQNNHTFSVSDTAELNDLWNSVKESQDINLKSKLLGVLSRACTLKESIYFIEQRIKLISPNSLFPDNYLKTIEALSLGIDSFSYQQLEDFGFICNSFNQYLLSENLTKEHYLLNRMRLLINTKLNHRIGIFIASMELMKHPELFEKADWFEFTENLFYQYPENSFRVQIYPVWLFNVIKMEKFSLLIEMASATQMMEDLVTQPNFLSEDELKYIHIPKDNLKKILENDRIPKTEKSVVESILTFSK